MLLTSNLVLVGAALEGREDRLVDAPLEASVILPEEDEASAGPTQRLVRRRRHHVGVLEGVGGLRRGREEKW